MEAIEFFDGETMMMHLASPTDKAAPQWRPSSSSMASPSATSPTPVSAAAMEAIEFFDGEWHDCGLSDA